MPDVQSTEILAGEDKEFGVIGEIVTVLIQTHEVLSNEVRV